MIKLTAIAIVAVNALFNVARSPDEWSATLHATNGSAMSGTVSAQGVGSADSTQFKISVRGATPNATLPWHVHTGACGTAGAVWGGEMAYPKLATSADGTAEASVTLAMRPSKTAKYAVQVHRGDAAPDAKPGSDVLACGDLRPVLNTTPNN
ncbi:MAG TPA: hypothetical protein VFU03_03925 [Gemmatimonadales bacterium]|nr:hypothetical protein [Gemmatimonadales bacterium]